MWPLFPVGRGCFPEGGSRPADFFHETEEGACQVAKAETVLCREASPGKGLTLHAGWKQVPGPAPVQGEGHRLYPPPPEETKVIAEEHRVRISLQLLGKHHLPWHSCDSAIFQARDKSAQSLAEARVTGKDVPKVELTGPVFRLD